MARRLKAPPPRKRLTVALWPTVAGAGTPWTRRAGALALVLAVAAIHGCIADRIAARLASAGASAAMPPRIEVAYVREMELAVPPQLAPAPPPPAAPVRRAPRRRAVPPRPPASAASAPAEAVAQAPPAEPPAAQPEAPVPQPDAPASAAAPPEASAPEAPAAAAFEPPAAAASEPSAPSAPAAAASAPAEGAPPFEWPASTRLTYALTGNYRGEIHGSAQVEWVREGERYQVHLDVSVGLPIAPLFTRRMTSDGRLTPEGLAPERYDEVTKLMGAPPRHATIRFEPDAVRLADGRPRVRWAGLQDAASQFVQLSWRFTLDPSLLAPGRVVEVPLALPRSVDRWVYDVAGPEVLYTPIGAVEAFLLKPRRVARAGGDLVAEAWFAPALSYLPARIRIHQDEQTYIDLVIKRKPQLAAQ